MIHKFLVPVPILGLGVLIILLLAWSANGTIDCLLYTLSVNKIRLLQCIAALLVVTISCILLSLATVYLVVGLVVRAQR